MASKRNRELQRFFDGDLSPRRAAKVQQQLEGSPEDKQRLESLGAMRGLLRGANEEAVTEASFDGLWARVQQGIAREQPPSFAEKLRVWFRQYGLIAASAAAAAVLAFFLWLPLGEAPGRNDCEIESLDADPGAVSTIFTIPGSDKSDKTTVIWVDESLPEGLPELNTPEPSEPPDGIPAAGTPQGDTL